MKLVKEKYDIQQSGHENRKKAICYFKIFKNLKPLTWKMK